MTLKEPQTGTIETASPAPRHQEPRGERLPLSALSALALVVFLAIVTETLPAGLLTAMSADLRASEPEIGQLITVYAATSALTAILLTSLTRRVPRRTLLLALVAGFAAVNAVTAVSDSYALTVVARIFGGMIAGMLWSMLAGYALRIVRPEHQGRALTIAMAGAPLAFAVGLPLGTFLGGIVGWHPVFGGIAAVTALVIVWIVAAVPPLPGEVAGAHGSFGRVLRTRGMLLLLATTLAFVVAHNVAYTYIGPLMRTSGLTSSLDTVLLVFGVSALVGIWLVGMFIDRHLRLLILGAMALLATTMLALAALSGEVAVTLVAVALWGLTYGSVSPLFQTVPAKLMSRELDVAQAMIVTIWNLGIGLGAVLGGVTLGTLGDGGPAWLAFAAAAVALVVAVVGRKRAFPLAGPRHP
ncbi:MFS transporter [Klugiella xanthotipulae]|uniref:Putative MFS family arabinose efflux permease n=1 Tax=Klugiella xanthotipulae TaxID=244735 RepID=A0A543I6M6_9MICO|nr:MFS transporter [Klugiella xanthotipulae]TQM66266.1 putative MFS family arabinose efflux permease [Klugiella xanthotipulae]